MKYEISLIQHFLRRTPLEPRSINNQANTRHKPNRRQKKQGDQTKLAKGNEEIMHLLNIIYTLFILRQGNNRSANTYSKVKVKAKYLVPQDHITNSSSSSLSAAVQIFARFSPLIGGPPLLPIHAEVMILETDRNSGDASTAHEEDGCSVVHRLDFIPKYPEDLGTIISLFTMQNVPGIVRHRKFASGSLFRKTNLLDSDINIVPDKRIQSLMTTNLSMENFSIVLPLGETVIKNDQRVMDIVRSPRCIVELVDKKNGMELNLLRNNCYSFTFDVLSSLK